MPNLKLKSRWSLNFSYTLKIKYIYVRKACSADLQFKRLQGASISAVESIILKRMEWPKYIVFAPKQERDFGLWSKPIFSIFAFVIIVTGFLVHRRIHAFLKVSIFRNVLLVSSNRSKIQRIFLKISALASKKRSNKKIKVHYYTN